MEEAASTHRFLPLPRLSVASGQVLSLETLSSASQAGKESGPSRWVVRLRIPSRLAQEADIMYSHLTAGDQTLQLQQKVPL